MKFRSIFNLCLVVALCGCGGGVGGLAVQSVEDDRRLGKESAKVVETYMGLSDTPGASRYMQSVGRRLMDATPGKQFDYVFNIVDMPQPNAFALPGGHIYISRGLMVLINSEDELANILSHEIIHVRQRHSAQKLAKQKWAGLLTLPGRAVGSIISRDIGQLLNSPIDNLSTAILAGYSRGNEFESDRLGQKVSGAAGYDPQALATILNRLEKAEQRRVDVMRQESFFDTHPTTPQRVQGIKAHAQKINWLPQSPIAGNRVDFLAHLKGLLIGRNPAKGIFKDQKFFHPGLDFFIEFPAGWKTINTPEMVGAIAPDKDGIMFLGLQGKGADAEKSAKSFIDGLNKEYEIEPSESKPVMIGEMDGYLVTLTDSTGEEPVHMHFLWVAKQGLIYQMIGLAPEHHRETLKTSALTFGSLNPAQRASIMETRLDIVSAKFGESLAQLSSRTGNIWDLPTTALMNEMSTDQSLKQGEPVKVAVSLKYLRQ